MTWGVTTEEKYVSPERLQNLEYIIYEKVRQKTSEGQDEGRTVMKAFKYFDLQNKGRVCIKAFKKALDKFGCVFKE